MKFIVACVGFSLIVLVGLLYILNQSNLDNLNANGSNRITKVFRIDKENPRIGIHYIVVFNTKPKTFAISGKSDSLGRRELLTSVDSVLLEADDIGWARDIYKNFDWTEKDNPEYIHRGRFVPFYNMDTLLESGEIKEIYREEKTYGFYRRPLSAGVSIIFILFFLISYFVLSVSFGWKLWQRILLIMAFLLILTIVPNYIYAFAIGGPVIFRNSDSALSIYFIQCLLFGCISMAGLIFKSKIESRYIYHGLYYLLVVFSFPIVCVLVRELALEIDDELYNSTYYFSSNWNIAAESMMASLGVGFAILAVFLMNNYKDAQRVEKLALQSQLRTKDQLNSLNARLNPHFLYNALNSIAGLIHQDATKAEEMTLAVSRFLKHFSNRKEQHVITVKEEVDIIVDYISIEKIRFGEKLIFTHEVDPLCMSEDIPRSILQPLIENAVKYGYNSNEDLIKVSLEIKKKDGQLIIRVYDSGRPFDESLDKGYGLSSVYNKLDLLYKNNYTISYLNDPEKHIEIVIYLINPTHHA